jgi:hypothetical protein
VRGQGDDQVPAGEDLAPGEVALGREHFCNKSSGVGDGQWGRQPRAPACGFDGGFDALEGPANLCQFRPPALEELALRLVAFGLSRLAGGHPAGTIGRVLTPPALSFDLCRALRMDLHYSVWDPAIFQCPRRPEGPGSASMA